MNIQFTDDELYYLFLVVDSRCRMMDSTQPFRSALQDLREKLLPVYRARHAAVGAEIVGEWDGL